MSWGRGITMMTTARTTLLETILVRMLTLMKVRKDKQQQQQRHQILVKIVKQNLVVIKVVMKIPYIRLKKPQ